GDVVADLDVNAAWAEMRHHQITPAADVYDDVVAALEVAVRRSDLLVWPAVLDERHCAIGRREYRFAIDVVAGQLGTSRLVGTAVASLENVESVSLSRGDVVVVHEFGMSALTDQPFIGQRGCDRHRIRCWPED